MDGGEHEKIQILPIQEAITFLSLTGDSSEEQEGNKSRELVSDRNEDSVGNWRKGHPTYEVAKNLPKDYGR